MNYPSEIPAGTLVDLRYKIVKTLGQGGFGRTYLVEDKRRFKKYCVLKEFVPQASDEYAIAKSRELFEREAKVLNQLEHRQIPKFYGWFEEDSRLFLVQQFVDGKTYAKLIQQRQQENRTFSESEVTQLLQDLLPVLQYIHTNNIIHRDISPDNIMLCNKADKPILIDFGVVNQVTVSQVASGGVSSGGTTVGKQSYSPLEQIGRGICFPSSDLYALGVTAMVLLTGKQPEDFYDAAEDKWQWRRYANVSDALASVIDKMSLDAHKERYQSAQEVLNDLNNEDTLQPPIRHQPDDTYIPPKPTLIDRPSSPSPQPKLNIPIIAAVGTLAILGGLFFFVTPNVDGVCDILNNCSSDIELEDRYQAIAERAEPILAIAADDNNLNTFKWGQLGKLKTDLEALVAELETIPGDAKVSDRAQETLADINTQLKRVEEAIVLEVKTDSGIDIGEGIFTNKEGN